MGRLPHAPPARGSLAPWARSTRVKSRRLSLHHGFAASRKQGRERSVEEPNSSYSGRCGHSTRNEVADARPSGIPQRTGRRSGQGWKARHDGSRMRRPYASREYDDDLGDSMERRRPDITGIFWSLMFCRFLKGETPDGPSVSAGDVKRHKRAGLLLERIPKKLIDFFDKNSLQLFDSGAISYRSHDSVRSESALANRLKHALQ
jgi:hypothetical protein